THLHQDHQSARSELLTLLGNPCAGNGCDVLGWPEHSTEIQLGPYQLTRLATPGHTPEAVSILLYKQQQLLCAFTGDVILPGGVGRTDLPGGDISALAN